jgi:hypothetical protein
VELPEDTKLIGYDENRELHYVIPACALNNCRV